MSGLIGALVLVGGLALIVWGAERFTDGALRAASRFAVSAFYVGAVVSGFEPENLVTGAAAAVAHLPQIALGTVIGSAVFLLTAALGLTLLLVPLPVAAPRAGPIAMLIIVALSAGAIWADGAVTRTEGSLLVLAALGLMTWLYRRSVVFRPKTEAERGARAREGPTAAGKVVGLLVAGTGAMLLGAELVVWGARSLISVAGLSETFLGMVVIGAGESLKETARMVTPARRGHPELAWGNVVGTVLVLLGFNLGVLAMIRPLTADPLVLRFHLPYLIGCAAIVAATLLWARTPGRGLGALLIALYGAYIAANLFFMRG